MPWGGEFVGVMPVRTHKWKKFHGLAFYYDLGEAVGAGLIEISRRGVQDVVCGWSERLRRHQILPLLRKRR